jgi:hypothetical protein
MLRFGSWLGGMLMLSALGLAAPMRAADTKEELKQLDTLQGYDQLPGEKTIKKDLTNVPNQPIETIIVWSEAKPTSGAAPLAVAFTADPPDNVKDPVYAWQFGDGATASGPSTSHTFPKPGIYKVILTVTSAAGDFGQYEQRIKVTK